MVFDVERRLFVGRARKPSTFPVLEGLILSPSTQVWLAMSVSSDEAVGFRRVFLRYHKVLILTKGKKEEGSRLCEPAHAAGQNRDAGC